MRFFRYPQTRLFLPCAITALAVGTMELATRAAEDAKPEEKPGFLTRVFGFGKKPKPEEAPPEAKPAPEPEPKPTSKKSGNSGESTAKKSTTSSSSKAKSSTSKGEAKKGSSETAKKKSEPEKETPKPKSTAADTAKAKEPEPKTASKTSAEPKAAESGKSKPAEKESKEKESATAKSDAKKDEPKDRKEMADKGGKAADSKTASTAGDKSDGKSAGHGDGEFKHGGDEPSDVTSSARTSSVTDSHPTTPSVTGPAAPLPPSQAGVWEVVKYEGRDYVTAESLHRFYRFSTYKLDGPHVWLRAPNLILKAQVDSQEMLINNVKFILSYPVAQVGTKVLFSRLDLCKLIEPILRPNYITGAVPFDTVVLDAGHGGHDSGARGVYGYEKDFALKMAYSVKAALEKRGLKVILTRSTDVFITLGGRVAIANKTPNSIFISLHFNSGGSAASGIETFALTPQGGSASLSRGGGYNAYGLTGNRQDSENIALATAVHGLVVHRFNLIDRGIKRAQWSVLTGCQRPGILFEGGFVTNATECLRIASANYREAVSAAIADAVLNYRLAVSGQALAQPNRR